MENRNKTTYISIAQEKAEFNTNNKKWKENKKNSNYKKKKYRYKEEKVTARISSHKKNRHLHGSSPPNFRGGT